MAWKFLNIGKANAEIERLEGELAEAKADSSKQPDPAAVEKITSLEKRIDDLASSIATLGDQVSTLENIATSVSDKFTVEIARIDKALADTTPEKIGTRIAAEITARQGQAPLGSTAGTTNNGGGSDIELQLQSIEDPKQRAAFFKTHEKELKARMSRNGAAK